MLALCGFLRPVPVTIVVVVLVAFLCRAALPRPTYATLIYLFALPVFALALYPPTAFDDTMYHLPLIRELAQSGRLAFHPELRFPLFPQLSELLEVPAYWVGGDAAAHVVSFAMMLMTVALLVDWGKRHGNWLAAALLAGGPIIVHLASSSYVEPALLLFITAGFYCIERDELALAGFFFGTACGVKYLALYFALAAALMVLPRIARFAAAGVAAALPTYAWIAWCTGNPLFPFLRPNIWKHSLELHPNWRLLYDISFARYRVGWQPPYTPLFAVAVIGIVIIAIREKRYRPVALMTVVYLIIFAFLPQDSRYLVSLMPLLFIRASEWIGRVKFANVIAILIMLPGPAYAVYRIAKQGAPYPRTAYLERQVPEYRALERAGSESVYVCGAEQMRYYARGNFLGDWVGPHPYSEVLAGNVHKNLERLGIRYFLISKKKCPMTSDEQLVYEDDGARLYRVR